MQENRNDLILKFFKVNRFDPKTDDYNLIANSSGNYILCLKINSKLPAVSIDPTFQVFEQMQVIYTGLASRSLRNRDFRQHFRGNNSGRSTLRKSLGVLFGYEQIRRDRNPNSRKTKFNDEDESKLTEWMRNNLMMFFFPTTDYQRIENELINYFNPPLNLKSNSNIENIDFRKLLSSLRNPK